MPNSKKIKLNNGVEIPPLGFGTFRLAPGQETEAACLEALLFS